MDIVNPSPLQFALIPGRVNFPGHSLTLIVKGTFDLLPGQAARMAEEQLFPTGDEFFGDDVDMTGAPRYESDFAYFKPRADLLLAGHCHCPGADPLPACPITFSVGQASRTLYVFGDRFWKTTAGIRTISDPVPFTTMELRYENSFGGEGFNSNPIGKGATKTDSPQGTSWPLPNIEDPKGLIDAPNKRPQPAGFGPMGRMWEQRYPKMGSYKGDYQKNRWPWFAEDFDYAYFNAAPPAMRINGYLAGDESLRFQNLHPDHPHYETSLPGIRVRCFVNRQDTSAFSEVTMNLDTLWADMDAGKLVLVWRGVTKISTEEYQDDLDHVFVMTEPLHQQKAGLEQCRELFIRALAEEEQEWEMAEEEPQQPEDKPVDEAGEEPADELSAQDLKKQIKASSAILLSKMGIDMNSLPPKQREKAEQEQEQVIERLAETDPDKMADLEQEKIRSQMSQALSSMGIDADNLPQITDKARAQHLRLFRELGMDDPDFMQAPEIMEMMGILNALMPRMGLDPEDLTPLIQETKKNLDIIKEEEEQEHASPLTREEVEQRASLGESFAGENLKGLDLTGLHLEGLDFTGADFTGALLSEAVLDRSVLANAVLSGCVMDGAGLEETDLSGADLSGARLVSTHCALSNFTGACLAGADLSGADLTGAILSGADLTGAGMEKAVLNEADATGAKLTDVGMTGANLSDAIFEQADMKNARLSEASGRDANFSEADLTGAMLTGADLAGADFSAAILDGADFKDATLSGASLEGATCIGADFTGADLTELRASEGGNFTKCSFVKAHGADSMWQDSLLDEADFSFSIMPGADFTGASLTRANLTAADMKKARFMKANLSQARLVVMNLFQANMEKADLTGADLRSSNMYGAEFLDAILNKTALDGANLKMTKLA